MRLPIIGIDVDEVCANLHEAWLARLNAKHGTRWTPDDIKRWDFFEDLGTNAEEMYALLTPDIYDEVSPVPFAKLSVDVLREEGFPVRFVSSCGPTEKHVARFAPAKTAWLKKYGFLKDESEFIPAWDKTLAPVDVLIDDKVEHVAAFTESRDGRWGIVITQPHNYYTFTPLRRKKSLADAVTYLCLVANGLRQAAPAEEPAAAPAEEAGRLVVLQSALPTGKAERKATPITSGVLDYFPAALAEIARVSKAGNDQHNPGQPLHWARGKSMDHADCVARHLMERGTIDTDGQRHSAKMAWRALALLQQELEDEGAPMSRASKITSPSEN